MYLASGRLQITTVVPQHEGDILVRAAGALKVGATQTGAHMEFCTSVLKESTQGTGRNLPVRAEKIQTACTAG
jgi:hypothetical protein